MVNTTYYPGIFDVTTPEQARSIILTAEAGLTPDQRWQRETDWLLAHITLPPGVVVDYGCGMGRLAKLINQEVIGIDISPSMRRLAHQYVNRPNFTAASPEQFTSAVSTGFRANAALAVWVLQHVLNPHEVLNQLADALLPGSPLFIVNRPNRCVPAVHGHKQIWLNDGLRVEDAFEQRFTVKHFESMPTELCEDGAYFWELIKK